MTPQRLELLLRQLVLETSVVYAAALQAGASIQQAELVRLLRFWERYSPLEREILGGTMRGDVPERDALDDLIANFPVDDPEYGGSLTDWIWDAGYRLVVAQRCECGATTDVQRVCEQCGTRVSALA